MSMFLRIVEILGPSDAGSANSFWSLKASSPRFDARSAWGAAPPQTQAARRQAGPQLVRIGTVADHVHPLRSLSLFPPEEAQKKNWRRPGLIAVNLLLGATNDKYGEKRDEERLQIRLGKDATLDVGYAPLEALGPIKMQTVPEASDNPQAPFVQVAVEPVEGPALWPRKTPDLTSSLKPAIEVPPLRLAEGRIPLRVLHKELKELHEVLVPPTGRGKTILCWLTPSGLQINARLPFPGQANPLQAIVEISPPSDGTLILTLIEPEDPAEWLKAWRSITPDRAKEIDFPSLRLRATDRLSLPDLRWRTSIKNGKVSAPIAMEVSEQALAFSLRSTADQGENAECQLATGWVSISNAEAPPQQAVQQQARQAAPAKKVKFEFGTSEPESLQLRWDASGTNNTTLSFELPLELETEKLSEDLRMAYGLEAPADSLNQPDGLAGSGDPKLPLLPAFVPLADGWLQLPIPNTSPASIFDKIESEGGPQKNVLGGFFRVRGDSNREAPWSVTAEGAQSCLGRVLVEPGMPQQGCTLRAAQIQLGKPRLLTRGLVWFSDDRPNSEEALPRLGAGPGRFIPGVIAQQSDRGLMPVKTKLDICFEQNTPVISNLELDLSLGSGYLRSPLFANKEAWLGLARGRRVVEGEFWRPIPIQPDLKRLASMVAAHRAGEPFVEDDWNRAKKLLPLGSNSARFLENLAKEKRLGSEQLNALLESLIKEIADSPAGQNQMPLWPAVVWRRHGKVPLSATMPMTRAAANSVRPLESREFIPMAIDRPATGSPGNEMEVARLERTSSNPFWSLDPTTKVKRLAGWPWNDGADKGFPQRGISFAMLGVPGVEVRPKFGSTALGAVAYEGAIRFDLPAQDEAHATAGLPPAEDGSRELAQPMPQGTALDWDLLREVFSEKERKHQISRVAESYVSPYFSVGPPEQEITVANLVKGTKWKRNAKIGMDAPYGEFMLADTTEIRPGGPCKWTVNGNEALKGYSGPLQVGAQTFALTGNAPATFEAGGIVLDNHQIGAEAPPKLPDPKQSGELHVRKVQFKNSDGKDVTGRLVTLPPVPVTLGDIKFEFFAKDVFIKGTDQEILPSSAALPFDVWEDDERLMSMGFEWRLSLPFANSDEDVMKKGRSELPLQGFRLEPLRLKSFDVLATAGLPKVTKVEIECQLKLGLALHRTGKDEAQPLVLTLTPTSDGKGMQATFEQVRVSFLVEKDARRVVYAAMLGKKFTLEEEKLEVEYAGCKFELDAQLSSPQPDQIEIHATPKEPAPGSNLSWIGIRKASVTISDDKVTSIETKAGVRLWQGGAAVFAWDDGDQEAYLFGTKIPVNPKQLEETRFGIALSLKSSNAADGWTMALAARVAGNALAAGVFRADCSKFAWPKLPCKTPDLKLRIHCGTPIGTTDALQPKEDPGQWKGTATLNGTVDVQSAIEWPTLSWDASLSIPLPDDNSASNSGRTKVSIEGGNRRTHKVKWHFQNHKVGLDLLAQLAVGSKAAVWQTLVRGEHTLTSSDGKTLKWSAVEAIAVGSASALIPEFDNYGSAGSEVTFAARYADSISRGQFGQKEEGMLWPGLGELAKVLQGHLSEAFRTAFWGQLSPAPIVILGGFIGFLEPKDPTDCEPLLRLPVLVGMDRLRQNRLTTCEVAWADGPAAPEIHWQPATKAASPITGEPGALWRALKAASEPSRLSLPVEQFFLSEPLQSSWDSPFFLASAISVELAVRRASDMMDCRAKSILAFEVQQIRSAASIELDPGPPGAIRPNSNVDLFVVGERVTRVENWRGTGTSSATGTPPTLKGAMRARAAAIEVQPRACLLAAPDRIDVAVFDPTELARPSFRKISEEYPDSGRGPSYSANGEWRNGWLHSPSQGHSNPIRDDQHSGVAGIASSVGLPSHAANQGLDNAVWLAHSRMPVYLPLRITKLASPPIAWLTPAPPHVRLPVKSDIQNALKNVKATSKDLQPFLPNAVSTLDVASRSGILFAERFRLLANLSKIEQYDPNFSRFGRPGQAGSSFVRKLRTPRPGPLPDNLPYPEDSRNRQLQASLVDPQASPKGVFGSANIIQGGAGNDAWAITLIASPDTDSCIDRNWNGKLIIQYLIESNPVPTDAWSTLVWRLKLKDSRAWLQVGSVQIEFFRLEKVGASNDHIQFSANLDGKLREALSGQGPLPDITLHWTVLPGALKTDPADSVIEWLSRDDKPIGGSNNANVTLTFPIYPINPDRGSLPLVPTTLLFTDPAYNRDLSSIPHSASAIVQSITPSNERGGVLASLMADARKVSRTGSLTFLYDVRFEKRLSEIEQLKAEANDLMPPEDLVLPGGDLTKAGQPKLNLRFELQKKQGGAAIKLSDIEIEVGQIYEISLSRIGKESAAVFEPGDLLQVSASAPGEVEVKLHQWQAAIPPKIKASEITRILQFAIMDGPAFEPPPARYDVLMALDGAVSAPLQAQSPLPARVEINEAARGFRRGMINRVATFIWTLMRPRGDREKMKLHVIKGDRNGQTSLPANPLA